MGLHIKHWITCAVLYEHDGDNLREAVETAVAKGICLNGASLDGASLNGARLVGAHLVGARLDGASLDGASLDDASLDGARLDGASLDGARLDGASLDGARLDGEALSIAPLAITGLPWPALITPMTMKIGCQRHSHEQWASFDDASILEMDGAGKALPFWSAWKAPLLAMCAAHRAEHFKALEGKQ